jgi:cytochrome c-type biogenesis protein CcmE
LIVPYPCFLGNYKLTYLDGTVVEAVRIPAAFTGAVDYINGDKVYFVNGKLHRDGGLPAQELVAGWDEYYVKGKRTGQFVYVI